MLADPDRNMSFVSTPTQVLYQALHWKHLVLSFAIHVTISDLSAHRPIQ